MAKETSEVYQLRRDAFLAVRATSELARLLKTELPQLQFLAGHAQYRSFSVPKKNGGLRDIEAPVPYLKKIQRRLNAFLQAVYYFDRTPAAHGYIISSLHELDCRNIVTNARKHRGRAHLLNLDLADFFHAITASQVAETFLGAPFHFRLQVAQMLAGLTTAAGRLPVGAPTSPVLSNLVCRSLDESLQELALNRQWIYTRYVDDLSISSHAPFSEHDLDLLEGIINHAGFAINPDKVAHYGPSDAKIVTGLVVGGKKVKLADGYLDQARTEVRQLAEIVRAQTEQGVLSTSWVDRLKQQVRGRISFIGFALGKQHRDYIQLRNDFYTAITPPEDLFGAVSWRGFQYF